MIIFIGFLLASLFFGAGYALCAVLIARDANVIRLGVDEKVVKKPDDGLVLVAVTPEMLRKFVAHREFDSSEARNLYKKAD